MSRHKGRRRPFARRRFIYPRHCDCSWGEHLSSDYGLFSFHTVRTVAPR